MLLKALEDEISRENVGLLGRLLRLFVFREKLKQLIEKRIGKENFVEKLGFITKHELYSRAALKPQPVFSSPEQMLFDHEFTKLVKELEGGSRSVFVFRGGFKGSAGF